MATKTDEHDGPRCPNHHVLLDIGGKPNGIGICPVSGAEFKYSFDEWKKKAKLRVDIFGRILRGRDWKVVHHKGDDI